MGSPVQAWDAAFRERYQKAHGTVAGTPPTEFVNARLSAVGPDTGQRATAESFGAHHVSPTTVVHRGARVDAVHCDRAALDERLVGPAVISDPGSTIYVPPGWSASTGPMGTVLLTRNQETS